MRITDINGMTDRQLIDMRDKLWTQVEAMEEAITQLRAACKPIQKLLLARLCEHENKKEERQLAKASQRIRGAVKRHKKRVKS